MMWFDGMGWFGWIAMASWWFLLAAGIGWLVRAASLRPNPRSSARQVLDERFAAGELSVADYEERRSVLG